MTLKTNLSLTKYVLRWAVVLLSCIIINSASYASLSLEGIQVYSPGSTHPGKKNRPADDMIRYQSADNLWDILRYEFSLPHYENHPSVQDNIVWFMDNQDFLMRTATRAAPYLYFIHQQVKKRKLPVELVLVPIIESGYNPFNLSSAGAAGIWQMMPDTATGFGVKQDWWYDGRRDIVASTKAALNYLTYLFDFFDGNSLLAIAAYNTGEGSVMSAIRRNIRDGKSTDFWSLPLPKETRIYVPRILALATIIAHPDTYHIQLPSVPNAPYLAQVDVGGQIDLKQAANYAGMSLKQFQHLNPGYNRLVTHPRGPYKLVLPIENVERFMGQLARTSLSRHIDWVQYKVKSHDSIDTIAKHFKTTTYALREINHLRSGQLKKGMRLVIPHTIATLATKPDRIKKSLPEELSAELPLEEKEQPLPEVASTPPLPALNAVPTTPAEEKVYANADMQPGDTLYMVRNNDTVEKIAERFRLSPKVVYSANKLHSYSTIRPGDQLLIPTHLATNTPSEELRKLSPGDTLYMIRQGDTIDKIAQKFRTTAAAIRVANLMVDSHLQEGEHIIVPTHLTRSAEQGRSFSLKIPS